jgi:hypothetical protein
VIEDGRIIERGTHAALVAAGGLYADMYRRQLLSDELAVEESLREEPGELQPESASGLSGPGHVGEE